MPRTKSEQSLDSSYRAAGNEKIDQVAPIVSVARKENLSIDQLGGFYQVRLIYVQKDTTGACVSA